MKKQTKTFVNRGGVRKYMNRLFPSDKVIYVYAQNKDGRFYPILTATNNAVKDYALADANSIVVNTDIVTA